MRSETLDELKAILDNAPDGATHYSNCESAYYKFKCECWMFCCRGKTLFEFVQDDDYVCDELRSLSDIKRIIELMELNQNMHTTVAGYIYGKDWEHWNEFNAGRFRL